MCCVEKHGVLSPMRSGKLNWTQLNSTELNWTGSFSSVEFSFPLCIEPATSWDDRRRFLTVKNRRRPSPVVAARRRLSSNDRHCVDWPIHKCVPIVKNLRRPPISSPNRRRSSPVQCTAGSWTELNSAVEFSFPLCIGLKQMRERHRDEYSTDDYTGWLSRISLTCRGI